MRFGLVIYSPVPRRRRLILPKAGTAPQLGTHSRPMHTDVLLLHKRAHSNVRQYMGGERGGWLSRRGQATVRVSCSRQRYGFAHNRKFKAK